MAVVLRMQRATPVTSSAAQTRGSATSPCSRASPSPIPSGNRKSQPPLCRPKTTAPHLDSTVIFRHAPRLSDAGATVSDVVRIAKRAWTHPRRRIEIKRICRHPTTEGARGIISDLTDALSRGPQRAEWMACG